jgi:hypothetical protein
VLHLRTASYPPECPAVRRRSRAHASQGRTRYCGVTPGSYSDAQPRSRPAIKVVAVPSAGWMSRSTIPALPPRPSALASHPAPHRLPVLWMHCPRRPSHRSRSSGGRNRQPPPQAAAESLTASSPTTNRAMVSPSSFPTPSPAKPATGAAQFWPEPPPPWPRTTLRLFRSFKGVFRESGTYP